MSVNLLVFFFLFHESNKCYENNNKNLDDVDVIKKNKNLHHYSVGDRRLKMKRLVFCYDVNYKYRIA